MTDARAKAATAKPEDLASYRRALQSYFRKRAPRGAVDDLVQEVFLSLQAREAKEPIRSLERYLFVVAGHVLSKERHRNAGWAGLEEMPELAELVSPEQILIGKDGLQAAMRVIEALPERTRQMFVLHRFEDRTYQSIARDFGVSVSAVEKHIIAALRALARGTEAEG